MADSPCDPKDVALAALANLIRLMGAELVVGRHRDDLGVFEQAVRGKVGAVALNGCAPEVTETGLALATLYIEQALAHIRLQSTLR